MDPSVSISMEKNGTSSSDHIDVKSSLAIPFALPGTYGKYMLPPVFKTYTNFRVYESAYKIYLIGSTPDGSEYRMLKINRFPDNPDELSMEEDPHVYDVEDMEAAQNMLRNSLETDGGLVFISSGVAILGFLKFLYGYYLHIVTSSRLVGMMGKHEIYSISDTSLIQLWHSNAFTDIHSHATSKELTADLMRPFEDDFFHPLASDDEGSVDEGRTSQTRGTSIHTIEHSVPSNHTYIVHFRHKRFKTQETKYKSLFLMMEMGKGDFFYSHTYPQTHRLQHILAYNIEFQQQQHLRSLLDGKVYDAVDTYIPMDFDPHFSWNVEQLRPLHDCIGDSSRLWSVSVLHGYFEQSCITVLNRTLTLTLIARRSALFAGTRYLKRGISHEGFAANEIEVEQILHDPNQGHPLDGEMQSHIQIRASIPLFWTQESNAIVAKPDITVTNCDLLHVGTRLHFANLFQRYGAPLMVVNLVKQEEKKPRETVVGELFSQSMTLLNNMLPTSVQIHYLPWDYKRIARSYNVSILDELAVIAHWSQQQTGMLHSHPKMEAILSQRTSRNSPILDKDALYDFEECLLRQSNHLHLGFLQRGVMRVNCIDSLDRTNVAQFCIGKLALGYQLYSLGLLEQPNLSQNTAILGSLLEMYERLGDVIALQYGGSQMHRQMKKDGAKSAIMAPVLYRQTSVAKPKELFVSLIRHYQNSFQDSVKQDAINQLLGRFTPLSTPMATPVEELHNAFSNTSAQSIWEIESDFYLHNRKPLNYFGKVVFANHRWWHAPLSLFEARLPWRDFVMDRSTLHFHKIIQEEYPLLDPLVLAGVKSDSVYQRYCLCTCHTLHQTNPFTCVCDCSKADNLRVTLPDARDVQPDYAVPLHAWERTFLQLVVSVKEHQAVAAKRGLIAGYLMNQVSKHNFAVSMDTLPHTTHVYDDTIVRLLRYEASFDFVADTTQSVLKTPVNMPSPQLPLFMHKEAVTPRVIKVKGYRMLEELFMNQQRKKEQLLDNHTLTASKDSMVSPQFYCHSQEAGIQTLGLLPLIRCICTYGESLVAATLQKEMRREIEQSTAFLDEKSTSFISLRMSQEQYLRLTSVVEHVEVPPSVQAHVTSAVVHLISSGVLTKYLEVPFDKKYNQEFAKLAVMWSRESEGLPDAGFYETWSTSRTIYCKCLSQMERSVRDGVPVFLAEAHANFEHSPFCVRSHINAMLDATKLKLQGRTHLSFEVPAGMSQPCTNSCVSLGFETLPAPTTAMSIALWTLSKLPFIERSPLHFFLNTKVFLQPKTQSHKLRFESDCMSRVALSHSNELYLPDPIADHVLVSLLSKCIREPLLQQKLDQVIKPATNNVQSLSNGAIIPYTLPVPSNEVFYPIAVDLLAGRVPLNNELVTSQFTLFTPIDEEEQNVQPILLQPRGTKANKKEKHYQKTHSTRCFDEEIVFDSVSLKGMQLPSSHPHLFAPVEKSKLLDVMGIAQSEVSSRARELVSVVSEIPSTLNQKSATFHLGDNVVVKGMEDQFSVDVMEGTLVADDGEYMYVEVDCDEDIDVTPYLAKDNNAIKNPINSTMDELNTTDNKEEQTNIDESSKNPVFEFSSDVQRLLYDSSNLSHLKDIRKFIPDIIYDYAERSRQSDTLWPDTYKAACDHSALNELLEPDTHVYEDYVAYNNK